MENVKNLWRETTREITKLNNDTLRAERLYFELKNWLPAGALMRFEGPYSIEITKFPRDTSPDVLFNAAEPGAVITRTFRHMLYMVGSICITISYAD